MTIKRTKHFGLGDAHRVKVLRHVMGHGIPDAMKRFNVSRSAIKSWVGAYSIPEILKSGEGA